MSSAGASPPRASKAQEQNTCRVEIRKFTREQNTCRVEIRKSTREEQHLRAGWLFSLSWVHPSVPCTPLSEGSEIGSRVMGKGKGGWGSRRAADTPRVSGESPTVRWMEGCFPSPAGTPLRRRSISRDGEPQGRRQAPGREGIYSQNPENRNLSKPHFQEK